MKPHSLARRAMLLVLLAQLLSMMALGGTSLLRERHTRLRTLDLQLEGRSDSLAGAIQDAEDPQDNVTVDPAEIQVPKEDAYAVYDKGGRLLAASSGAPRGLLVRYASGYRSVTDNGVSYRVYQRDALRIIDRAESNGVGLKRPVTIVYASPERHVRHEIAEAVRFYLIAIVLTGAGTAAFVTMLLRKELQPLNDLALAAGMLTPRTLRFEAPPAVRKLTELQPLVSALTNMTTELRHAFEKEQQFLGDAAHELKTAVAVVRSSIQVLMLRQRSIGEYHAGLEDVLQDNSRVENLVAQMLRLAASTEANEQTEKHVVDLAAVAAEVCFALRPVAALRSVTLQQELQPGSHVRLSSSDAYTLVSNLLLNAIQHSRAETSVGVQVVPTGQELHLQVRDSGEGISPSALPHIFERFYREDASRSRDTGGAGLGLSICKAIVDAAGGTIQVSSTQGLGTTVTVAFLSAS